VKRRPFDEKVRKTGDVKDLKALRGRNKWLFR
jgi:hypothetical protein